MQKACQIDMEVCAKLGAAGGAQASQCGHLPEALLGEGNDLPNSALHMKKNEG